MAEKSDRERVWQEKEALYARLAGVAIGYTDASVQFGKLAVQSAFIVNGGALFALPAYVASIKIPAASVAEASAYDPTFVVYAALAFVIGIVLAGISSFVAYLNFQYHTIYHGNEVASEVADIEEFYDVTSFHNMKKSRDEYRAELAKEMKKYHRRINVTLVSAIILAFSSYGAFCVGCYYSGRTLLS